MTRILFAAVAALVAGPALAGQCPALMGQVEAALADAAQPAETVEAATALLEEGRALHGSGDHAASEAKLDEALALLAPA